MTIAVVDNSQSYAKASGIRTRWVWRCSFWSSTDKWTSWLLNEKRHIIQNCFVEINSRWHLYISCRLKVPLMWHDLTRASSPLPQFGNESSEWVFEINEFTYMTYQLYSHCSELSAITLKAYFRLCDSWTIVITLPSSGRWMLFQRFWLFCLL